MTRFKTPQPPVGGHKSASSAPKSGDVIRRFFDLIERFERPKKIETKSHPEYRARISRLDDETPRR